MSEQTTENDYIAGVQKCPRHGGLMFNDCAPCSCPPGPPPQTEFDHMTYEQIAARATSDSAFRDGLQQAAAVCRAQGRGDGPPCPSQVAAVYLDRLANGEQP